MRSVLVGFECAACFFACLAAACGVLARLGWLGCAVLCRLLLFSFGLAFVWFTACFFFFFLCFAWGASLLADVLA